jgi:hypothetical protein
MKSDDGKRFVKSEEMSTEFEQTEAYSELIMDLLTNEDSAVTFLRSIVPADISEKLPEHISVDEALDRQ